MALGFLHTSATHVQTFDALVAARAPGTAVVHAVDPGLLDDARRRGMVDDDLVARIAARLVDLRAAGAGTVVCTCGTIAPAAEALGALRVDRPMAAAAVRDGRPVAVVVAVESGVEPALALLREEAARAGTAPELVLVRCLDAWPLFEAGDVAGYEAAIAAAVDALPADRGTVVLAQASMAGAADRVRTSRRVLTSPAAAVDAALRAADGSARP